MRKGTANEVPKWRKMMDFVFDTGLSVPGIIVLVVAFLYCLIYGLHLKATANADSFRQQYNEAIPTFQAGSQRMMLNSTFKVQINVGNNTLELTPTMKSIPSPYNNKPGLTPYNTTIVAAAMVHTFDPPTPDNGFKSTLFSVSVGGCPGSSSTANMTTSTVYPLWTVFRYPISLQQGMMMTHRHAPER